MKDLTEDDKSRIIKAIQAGSPLTDSDLQLLFPQNSEPRLYWPQKSARPLPQGFIQHQVEFNPKDTEPTSSWKNHLFNGDCLSVLSILKSTHLNETIQQHGGIKLIYMDPPFDVGADFKLKQTIGPNSRQTKFSPVAYRDSWSQHSTELLNLLYSCFVHIHALLADDGSFYVHCDWRLSGVIRLMLDEIFGKAQHRNEICWRYNSRTMASQWFARKHDSIFVYSKGCSPIFNTDAVRTPHKPESKSQYNKIDSDGRSYKPQSNGKRSYLNPLGQPCSDVWDIQLLGSRTPERSGYPTQKPLALLERIIKAASNEGDIVADLFCGSGVMAEAAHRLNRRWLAADIGPLAIQTTSKRMLSKTVKASFMRSDCGSDQSIANHIDWHKMLNHTPQSGVKLVTQYNTVTAACLQNICTEAEEKEIIVLALEYSPNSLEWLLENRNKFCVSLKIIPRHQVYSVPKNPIFCMPALCPRFQIHRSKTGFEIEIKDIKVMDTHPQSNAPFEVIEAHLYSRSNKNEAPKQLTHSWSDWIEGWTVEMPNQSGHSAVWHHFRDKKTRALVFLSHTIGAVNQSKITVTLYDVFGYSHRRTISLQHQSEE